MTLCTHHNAWLVREGYVIGAYITLHGCGLEQCRYSRCFLVLCAFSETSETLVFQLIFC